MTFLLIHRNVTDVTSASVTPNPSGAFKFTLEFIGVRVTQSLVFYIVFCRFFLLPFSVSSLHCLTFELRFLITPSNHFYCFMKYFAGRLSFCFLFFSSLYCLSSELRFRLSLQTIRRFPCSALHIIIFPFALFRVVIILSDLRITVSDYPFKQSLVCLCVVFFRSLCVLLSFVMSSVLQFTTSDYPFILSFQQKMLQ